MFNSVTNWLRVNLTVEDDTPEQNEENSSVVRTQPENEENTTSRTDNKDSGEKESAKNDCMSASVEEEETQEESLIDSATIQRLEDVSSMAFDTAKQFGSALFSFGKAAGKTVAEQASKLKTAVEETALLDFSDGEEEGKRKPHKMERDAVPPWVGFHEEEIMKKQILELSSDKRNFLRAVPPETDFTFDFDTAYPVALATLREDNNLQKMRFELVPKWITEESFWKNYFYRVSLIKESVQLETLEHLQTENSYIDLTNEKQPESTTDTNAKASTVTEDDRSTDDPVVTSQQDEAVGLELEQAAGVLVMEDETEDGQDEWVQVLQQELAEYAMEEEREGRQHHVRRDSISSEDSSGEDLLQELLNDAFRLQQIQRQRTTPDDL